MIFAYPTESFYALGVPATDAKAIQQLFRVKHREPNKPIALIAADIAQVKKFFYVSSAELRLMKKYWPGALTILLKPKTPSSLRQTQGRLGRRGAIAVSALLGLTTPSPLLTLRRGPARVGVRVPDHAPARELALECGAPITATSANISDQPPTKSARKLKRDFPDIMIVPGQCGQERRPSTVVEIIKNKIIIHRQGSLNLLPKGARIPGDTTHV